jgi:DNA-directed RNA polymerase subunit RPC12/RpoP
MSTSLQEIIKVALEIQRDLGSLSVLNGDDRVIVEPGVVEEEVASCKPCRVYTMDQEKPEWAVYGCSGKGKPTSTILEPQLPASEKPAKKQWGSKIRQNGRGFSCIHPECQQYDKIFPKKSAAQQHAKKHYPPEYRCSDCDGEWYLKTEWEQHLRISCPHCDKIVRKGSLSGHLKTCKNK